MPSHPPITSRLAAFVASTTELPATVQAMSRLCLIDWFGATLGGSREALAQPLLGAIERLDASSQSSVIGHSRLASCAHAALANGTLSHALELDDVHLRSAIHGSAPVWAAALAVGEHVRASTQEISIAFAVGYEVMARVGLPTGQLMISANHHPTGVLGYFGAAAAVGRLLKLDEHQQCMAFGIAAGQAGASTQVRGTMSKPFFAGHSAHGGLLSAFLANSGFISTSDAFEGAQGILNTYAPGVDSSAVLEALGDRWEVDQNAFKVHASCAMSHALVDGLIALRDSHGLKPDDIESITLRLFPHCTEYLNKPTVKGGLEGKFSAQYCAAVAILDGVAQELQFTDSRAKDPETAKLMAKVKLVADQRYALDQAHVTVNTSSGRTVSQEVLAVLGSPAKPVSGDALDAKFLNLSSRAMSEATARQLLAQLKAWPHTELASVMRLARSCEDAR